MTKPIAFFVHHQGRGHAKRCEAILRRLDAPAIVMTADPSLFGPLPPEAEIVPLPDMIGAPSRTEGLHAEKPPSALHCVPLGVEAMREHMGAIADVLRRTDPALFVVDVSAEIALLSRILSVPAVSIRMHGNRSDACHLAAYEASVAMIAPYDESIEQDDYPDWARVKTFYSGGLCGTGREVPAKEAARAALGLPQDRHIALVLSGGGGLGTPYAPLTMAARALPDTEWHVIGAVTREGHETDFANLVLHGWSDRPLDWIAAADVVVGSAGDNTVHEIARAGRPFLCVPEWRYFDEQVRKVEALAAAGAAHALPVWPGHAAAWREAIEAAEGVDLDAQRALHAPDAAEKIARHLMALSRGFWAGEGSSLRLAAE